MRKDSKATLGVTDKKEKKNEGDNQLGNIFHFLFIFV